MKIGNSILFGVFCSVASMPTQNQHIAWHKEYRIDWNAIDLSDDTFWPQLAKNLPSSFSFGIATSNQQLEGAQTVNGAFAENNWTQDPLFAKEFVHNTGTDHWQRAMQDVDLIAASHVDAYRLSIPWEKIEPQEGQFDQQALHHYIKFVSALKNKNITPWICLFHFTLPTWFMQKGGFEKEENIHYFVRFCTYIFEQLHHQVPFWVTFNEPVAYAIEGYFRGTFPPHKALFSLSAFYIPKLDAHISGIVLKNMLQAHVQIYKECKKINPDVNIGIIKMFHILDAYGEPWNPLNTLEKKIAKLGNHITHDSVLDFFKNGVFKWLFNSVAYKNLEAPSCLDFIGVNYYTHELLRISPWTMRTDKARAHEETTPDNGRAIYPEGLYRAIAKASTLKKPIYVTENGIADSSDQKRNTFLKKHLYMVQKAIADGFDIRGYYYWTLMDCLGWKHNYHSKYGIYAVDPTTKNRRLRTVFEPFINFLKNKNPH